MDSRETRVKDLSHTPKQARKRGCCAHLERQCKIQRQRDMLGMEVYWYCSTTGKGYIAEH